MLLFTVVEHWLEREIAPWAGSEIIQSDHSTVVICSNTYFIYTCIVIFYRIVYTTAFVKPVVEHWLEREMLVNEVTNLLYSVQWSLRVAWLSMISSSVINTPSRPPRCRNTIYGAKHEHLNFCITSQIETTTRVYPLETIYLTMSGYQTESNKR